MSEFNNTNDRALSWEDEINSDGFQLLPDGDYDFTIVNFERDRFDGSEKSAPCPVAKLTLRISSADGDVDIKHSLYLRQKSEWQLGQFFCCIGQKKRGEPLRPKWDSIVGAKGRCRIGRRTYKDTDYNEVKKFYERTDTYAQSGSFEGGF